MKKWFAIVALICFTGAAIFPRIIHARQMSAQPNNSNIVVSTCGAPPTGYPPSGRRAPDTVDTNGNKCVSSVSVSCPPGYTHVQSAVTITDTTKTTLVAAPGAGLKVYIFSGEVANTGGTSSLITFTQNDGSNTVLGYTINPTVSGSNIPYVGVIQTSGNFDFQVTPGSSSSTQYISVQGCTGP
jgi:hypothetical protein